MRQWPRAIPTVAVLLLLALAAFAPSRGARASRAPGGSLTGAASVTLQPGNGVAQPFEPTVNAVACTLGLAAVPYGSYASGSFTVLPWDPLLLAPDATTVPYRCGLFDPSTLYYNHVRLDFQPALVTLAVPHVAEPPRPTLALEYFVSGAVVQTGYYDTDGSAETPTAYFYESSTSLPAPLPGDHPVLSFDDRSGPAQLDQLRLVQSVMGAATRVVDENVYECAQRIRVPVRVAVNWFELAVENWSPFYPWDPGAIYILDGAGQSVPPATLPAPLATVYFGPYYNITQPSWQGTYDLDQQVTLEPDHDYWLVVRTVREYRLRGRVSSGAESPDFQAGIGPFFARGDWYSAWAPQSSRSLAFRLIGQPIGNVGVPEGPLAATALRLVIAPNPTHGAAQVRWSGASGALALAVLDARGRRVATARSDGGADGRWSWGGTLPDGRSLPSGVYFVTARDARGRFATERVVLVR